MHHDSLASSPAPSTVDPRLLDLLEELLDQHRRMVDAFDRLAPPAEVGPESGPTSRPALRLVR
jgi:hypothetical protein